MHMHMQSYGAGQMCISANYCMCVYVKSYASPYMYLNYTIRLQACYMILQVVLVLKKEVANTSNGGGEGDSGDLASYRQSLVRTLHSCSIRFASVAPAVVPLVRQGNLFVVILLISQFAF